MWGDFSSKLTKIKHNFVFWSRLVFGASMKWKNWKKKIYLSAKMAKNEWKWLKLQCIKNRLDQNKKSALPHILNYYIQLGANGSIGFSLMFRPGVVGANKRKLSWIVLLGKWINICWINNEHMLRVVCLVWRHQLHGGTFRHETLPPEADVETL